MASSNPHGHDLSIESRITVHRYGHEHILQYYEVFRPAAEGEEHGGITDKGKVWIVYIHGGAWRDPLITSSSFIPFLKCLYPSTSPASSSPISHIAGIASLSYRLSPHSSYPQDPSQTPAHDLRNAQHPQHIEDVVSAIADLQERYKFGNRYVIVGHSCGATLALQVAMNAAVPWNNAGGSTDGNAGEERERIGCPLPVGIVGVEGIYDIDLLLHDYSNVPAYREFIESAFGDFRNTWLSASPAQKNYEDYVESWADKVDDDASSGTDGDHRADSESGEDQVRTNGRRKSKVLALLAHSLEDELVNMGQVDKMASVLKGEIAGHGQLAAMRICGVTAEEREEAERKWAGIEYRFLELRGRHHEIWERGSELARCVVEAVGALFPGDEG